MAILDGNLRREMCTLLILLGFVGICLNVNAQDNIAKDQKSTLTKSTWKQLADDLSFYEPIHTLFYDNEIEEELAYEGASMFTKEDIQLYRDVFKFAPNLKGSAFGDILEKGSIPTDFVFHDGKTLETILEELALSQDFHRFIEEKFIKVLAHISHHLALEDDEDFDKFADVVASPERGFDADSRDDEVDTDQVGGWKGCCRDYNALALPWTNGILTRLGKIVIERLIPEENFQCDVTCRAVCTNRIGMVAVCNQVCDVLCQNATYENLVNRLLNIFFPQKQKTSWHRAMFDAMGKVPPGIVDGQLHWSGAYDRCYAIDVNYTYIEENITGVDIIENRKFSGQYFRLPLKPPVFQDRILTFLYGACVPSTCDRDGVVKYITQENDLFRLMNQALNWTIDEERMFTGIHDNDITQQPGLVFLLIILLGTIIVGILPATIYDIYFREGVMKRHVEKINKARTTYRKDFLSQMSYDPSLDKKKQGELSKDDTPDSYYHIHSDDYRRFSVSSEISDNFNNNNGTRKTPPLFHSMSTQSTTALVENYTPTEIESEPITIWDKLEVFFVSFSGYSNLKRILRVRELDTDLPALDCVRFLSYAWGILGYTWLLGPVLTECWITANLRIVLTDFIRSWSFQVVVNFHFTTDSYFVISGILVAYWWLKQLDGKQQSALGWTKTCLLFYLKRYWRILPAFMLNLLFYSMTYKYLASGPFAPHEVGDAENCKVNWWSNMLMMHNIVNTDQLCLSWTWFLPALFQLLIMCPLILIPLVIKPMFGYIILVAVYVIHIAITAGVVGSMTSTDEVDIGAWVYDYFFTPWCRAGAFIIGIAYGIILQKKPRTYKMPKWFVLLGFVLSLVMIGAAVYGTYGIFKLDGGFWDRPARVIYNTFARSAFALGVGFIILICCTGNAGFVGEVMNWRGFQPLSRLSSLAYFMSAPLIFSHAYGILAPLWISSKVMLHWFLSNMITTNIAGMVLTGLCVHYPYTLGIERTLRVKSKEDCIKAGRHPDIVELGGLSGSFSETPLYDNVADMNNPLRRSVSMDAGYDQNAIKASEEYTKLEKIPENPGFNRQNSTTSL